MQRGTRIASLSRQSPAVSTSWTSTSRSSEATPPGIFLNSSRATTGLAQPLASVVSPSFHGLGWDGRVSGCVSPGFGAVRQLRFGAVRCYIRARRAGASPFCGASRGVGLRHHQAASDLQRSGARTTGATLRVPVSRCSVGQRSRSWGQGRQKVSILRWTMGVQPRGVTSCFCGCRLLFSGVPCRWANFLFLWAVRSNTRTAVFFGKARCS